MTALTCIQCSRAIRDGQTVVTLRGGFLHTGCREEYDRHAQGLKHECPQCKRSGHAPDPTGRTRPERVPLGRDETPLCAYDGCMGCEGCRTRTRVAQVPVQVTCPLCGGVGWLREKPEAVTETRVVGWRFPWGES